MPPPKPRLLYILHQYEHLGGAELQTRHLVRELSDRYEIAVACPDRDRRQIILHEAAGSQKRYPADPFVYPFTPYHQTVTEQGVAELLREFKANLIHVQGLVFWPLSLLEQLAAGGIPTVVTLHDFYAITPIYTLQGTGHPQDVFSLAYSQEQFGVDARDYLIERRDIIHRGLTRCSRRLVVSNAQKQLLSSVYPLEYGCIEPGIVPFSPLPKQPAPGLRFGYFGSLIPQKGWMPLVEAFQKVLQKHPSARLTLHGPNPPTGAPPPGVRATGEYKVSDLPRIFSEVDVGMIPSICAETFSMALSEMWQAGVPAGVSDIGALSTRVIDGVNGKKFPAGDIAAMTRTMQWFIENDEWRRWQLPTPPTVVEMAARLDVLYHQILGN